MHIGDPVPADVIHQTLFDIRRRMGGLLAGPLVLVAVWAWPLSGLSLDAHRLLAIVALVVVWWVTEAIPIAATALIGTALTVLFGVTTAADAFAPFASPTIFLFMGSFMVGLAIAEHGLDQRLAVRLLGLPSVAGDIVRMRVALGILTLVVSGWISNTATTAMMVPLTLGVLSTARRADAPFSAGFLLTIAYAASIGGTMTPVGSPPNLITLGLLEQTTGVRISFLSWMALTVPIALAYGGILLVASGFIFRPTVRHIIGQSPTHGQLPYTPLTPGQRNCAIAFALAVALWVLPGVLALAGVTTTPPGLAARLDEGVVAIMAAGLLFVLPVDWKRQRFTLDWRTASQIDWGTILLFGGGLSLGRLMFTTGLAEHLGKGIVQASGAESLWAITAVATASAVLLSEFTSNTAATSMLLPVVLAICTTTGLNPVPPALGVCMGASLSFMLPISTPPNAIVYGTGLVPLRTMVTFGAMMDVVGFVVIMVGLRVLCPLLGFA